MIYACANTVYLYSIVRYIYIICHASIHNHINKRQHSARVAHIAAPRDKYCITLFIPLNKKI